MENSCLREVDVQGPAGETGLVIIRESILMMGFLRMLLLLACLPGTASAMERPLLRVDLAYVGSEHIPSAYLGVTLGLEEANLQGRFLGQEYRLVSYKDDSMEPLRAPVPSAIITATDAESTRLIATLNPDVPVLNIAEGMDRLRSLCLPNLFHVIPSQAMYEAARSQWREMHPDSGAEAVAWHPGFMKYAGKQLNKRYRKTTGEEMDDYAWAGWAAVKLVSDSIARLESADPGRLRSFLRNRLEFDGQKGIPMTFRSDGQLRQLMLLVEKGRVVGEAPVAGVVDRHDLDSLIMPNTCTVTNEVSAARMTRITAASR